MRALTVWSGEAFGKRGCMSWVLSGHLQTHGHHECKFQPGGRRARLGTRFSSKLLKFLGGQVGNEQEENRAWWRSSVYQLQFFFYPKGSNKEPPSMGLTLGPRLHLRVSSGCVERGLCQGTSHQGLFLISVYKSTVRQTLLWPGSVPVVATQMAPACLRLPTVSLLSVEDFNGHQSSLSWALSSRRQPHLERLFAGSIVTPSYLEIKANWS